MNLEDNLQTTETVGGFSQDLQTPGNRDSQTMAHATSWGNIMLGHINQSRKWPIVQLDHQLPVYAMRLVKSLIHMIPLRIVLKVMPYWLK